MTNYFMDTEFIESREGLQLLSFGIVSEDKREYYAETRLAGNMKQHPKSYVDRLPWLVENVVPLLIGGEYIKYEDEIADDVLDFVKEGDSPPLFWSYFADYDWVVFCQLYGTMMRLPAIYPQFCMDIQQLRVMGGFKWLPEQTTPKHNALNDAHWHREMYAYAKNQITKGKNQLIIP